MEKVIPRALKRMISNKPQNQIGRGDDGYYKGVLMEAIIYGSKYHLLQLHKASNYGKTEYAIIALDLDNNIQPLEVCKDLNDATHSFKSYKSYSW